MATPKKRRGYSPIHVDGSELAWRVSVHHVLHVRGQTNGGCALCVEYGGFDPYLEIERRDAHKSITPAFVADAIRYAMRYGWNPDARTPEFRLNWNSSGFSVAHNPQTVVREEAGSDTSGIHTVNNAAFETPGEAKLVDALRDADLQPFISLVAEHESRVIGHILFSPVTVFGEDDWSAIALGPMAVLAEFQRKGIGSQLVNAGLVACKSAGHDVVFVLGHPEYYPRFGFRPMADFGITCEFEAPREVLMVTELTPGAIAGRKGEVRYHPLFKSVA